MRRIVTSALAAAVLWSAGAAAGPHGPADAFPADAVPNGLRGAASPASALTAAIAGRLADGEGELRLSGQETAGLGIVTLDRAALRALYGPRGHRPLWVEPVGALHDDVPSVAGVTADPGAMRVAAIAGVLSRIDRHGLDPGAYHAAEIAALVRDPDRAPLALELLTSAAVMDLATHLSVGRLDPADVEAEIDYPRPSFDAPAAAALVALSRDPAGRLTGFAPRHAAYAALPEMMDRLDAAARAGGWPTVPDGATLRPGDRDAAVAALRARLTLTGDLPARAGDPPLDGLREVETRYDAALAAAVERFQARHGLAVDGIVGRNTRAALNVPVDERRGQVLATLERWRWAPNDLGDRHILVNVPAYELTVVEESAPLRRMDVIVGRDKRQTPLFSSSLTWTEFNPTWTVPRSIAERDILPELIADPGYLARKNMQVYAEWTHEAPALDPYAIDWQALGRGVRYFMFRQEPGPGNALGRVKFMMSNTFSVYLHDTPDRHLFARSRRAYSSGCIRVADPMWLADFVLDGSPSWRGADSDPVLRHWRTRRITMPRAVPLHVVYATAWIGEDGAMRFREDVYGLDAAVVAALDRSAEDRTRIASAE